MKIKVLSNKRTKVDEKGKETTFYTYFSPVMIHVIDENGEDLGEQKKNISIHFTKLAMKKIPDDKVFAIIGSSKTEDIQLPFVYHMGDTDGKNDGWVKDFETFDVIPFTPKQSTCKPILEEESEPIEIVEENE